MTGRYGILTGLEPGDLIYMCGIDQPSGHCYIDNLPLSALMFETGGLHAQMFVSSPHTRSQALFDLERAGEGAPWCWGNTEMLFRVTFMRGAPIDTVIAELGGSDDVAEWTRMMMHRDKRGPAAW